MKKLSIEKIRSLILESLVEIIEQSARGQSSQEFTLDSAEEEEEAIEIPGVGVMIDPNANFAFPVPISSFNVNQYIPERFRAGSENRPTHSGDDWQVPEGTIVISVGDGVVASIEKTPGTSDGCGCRISLDIDNLGRVIYCHLNSIKVSKGEKVTKGQIIGSSGGKPSDPCSGTSTGPHLHFSLQQSSDKSVYDLFYSQCTGFKPL